MKTNPTSGVAEHPIRVLIVDDERDNRELLALILTWEGYVPQMASSGEEALASVAPEPPDVILLDAMMPGMTGYEVAAELKGSLATKNIPIIMLTALDAGDAKALALGAGAEDFLTKPFDRAELCARVKRLSPRVSDSDGADDANDPARRGTTRALAARP